MKKRNKIKYKKMESFKEFKNEIVGIYDIKRNDVNKDINLLNYFESDDIEDIIMKKILRIQLIYL